MVAMVRACDCGRSSYQNWPTNPAFPSPCVTRPQALHRLFSIVTGNWRGKPFISHQVVELYRQPKSPRPGVIAPRRVVSVPPTGPRASPRRWVAEAWWTAEDWEPGSVLNQVQVVLATEPQPALSRERDSALNPTAVARLSGPQAVPSQA